MVSELTPPLPPPLSNATSVDTEEAGAIYRSSLFSSRQQVHLHLQILRYIMPHHISVSLCYFHKRSGKSFGFDLIKEVIFT